MQRYLHRTVVPAQLLLALLCGCADRSENAAPHVVPVGLKQEDRESFLQFCRDVVPVLERRCGVGCHAVAPSDFVRIQKDPEQSAFFFFPMDLEQGRIPRDEPTRIQVFEVVRGHHAEGSTHAAGANRIEYAERPIFSPLLRAPLALDLGGIPHRGLDVFTRNDDPDFQALYRWVETEVALHSQPAGELSKPQIFFRDEILPVLVRNGCFIRSCHGPTVFNDLKLEPPLPAPDGTLDPRRDFSTRAVLHNHRQMLGVKSRFANLGGDLHLSRLLAKNLPLEKGGVHQRGGNIQFFEDLEDPDVQRILAWLSLEKAALASRLDSQARTIKLHDLGKLEGILFIRGPRHQPRRFFDLETFYPGSDIFLLKLQDEATLDSSTAAAINLTARFHRDRPAEIHSFDVRYDGRAVVFSMRTSKEEGFRLYQFELDQNLDYVTDSFQPLTFHAERRSDGVLIHCVDPIYSPGPNDAEGWQLDDVAITYATNAAGDYTASDAYALLGEADGGDGKLLIDAQRTEKPGTFDGRRLYVVDGPHKGEWRTIVRHLRDEASVVGARFELDRPLPGPVDRRTVYVIEKPSADYRPAYDIWRLVPSADADAQRAFSASARRMTFTSAQERRPTMRTTGEVMFTSVRNVGFQADRPVFNGAIFRVMAGGFDYHIQGGNRSRYPLYIDSREMPQGLEIRHVLDPRNLWGGGALMLVDHGFGVHIEPENPVDNIPVSEQGQVLGRPLRSSSRRFLPAMVRFFPETGPQAVTFTGQSPGGSIRDAFPLPDGTILLSRTAAGLDHLDPQADPDWNIAHLRFDGSPQSPDGRSIGSFRISDVKAASTDSHAEYYPRPVMVRLKEHPKTHQKFAVRLDGKKPQPMHGVLRYPDGLPGEVECYDYPLLQSFLTHFAPVGPRDFRVGPEGPLPRPYVPEQTLHYVRIIAQEPLRQADLERISAPNEDPFATRISLGIHTRKRIIAEIPLEPDGSFYARVPTEVPLIVQGLNRDRMALHSMNRWFYLQPGEKLTFSIPRKIFPTLCSGCHGALTGQSQHALGPPDVVSSASRVLATWDPVAKVRRAPYNSEPGRSNQLTVDFRRDVQPILNRHCVSCHDGQSKQAAGLDLRDTPTKHYTVAYETLHRLREPDSGNFADKAYINEREALAVESYLIEKLTGKELLASRPLDSPGVPHPPADPLTTDEILTLIRWIDLGATFLGGGDAPPDNASSLVQLEASR